MYFRSHKALSLFVLVAQHRSFTSAANALNLTKGAVSHQMNRLELDLGFAVFYREPRGIRLTTNGLELLRVTESAYSQVTEVIDRIKKNEHPTITVGMSTYFASRWLSPRLMKFTSSHPHIGLRLQPVTGPVSLQASEIDLLVKWGERDINDPSSDTLFSCSAMPTSNKQIADRVLEQGLEKTLENSVLLHDHDDSQAWQMWHKAAGLSYFSGRRGLVIPDPNVRVQAVIDGQGIALNDRLVASEIRQGTLHRISMTSLETFGYHLVHQPFSVHDKALKAFCDWIRQEAAEFQSESQHMQNPYPAQNAVRDTWPERARESSH